MFPSRLHNAPEQDAVRRQASLGARIRCFVRKFCCLPSALAVLATVLLTAGAHAMAPNSSDAGDIIAHSVFPAGMGNMFMDRAREALLALPAAFRWFGSGYDWLWAIGLAVAGIVVGSCVRYSIDRLFAHRKRKRAWTKLAFWMGRELSFFAGAALFFALFPPWEHIHGMAVSIAASFGGVIVMRSLTTVILKVGHSPNAILVRDVGNATAVVAGGYIVLGMLRMSDAPELSRALLGLVFWLVFLGLCSSMSIRFRSAAGKWRASDIVSDPISALLLGQRSLFFGTMLLVIGTATILSAFNTGPRAYAYGVSSIALLALLPTAVAMAPGFISKAFQHLGPWQQAVIRSVRLLTFLAFWVVLARIWGIDLFDTSASWFGHEFGRAIIDICIAIAIAYLLWEIMHTGLDVMAAPHRTSIPGEDAGHLPSATRLQTFVPLLRAMLLGFIFTATGMIALAALGVNIGPLLAGAGIIGVAIGFGSQSLVKDVISGIFFLADDAFRIGEYVEVGNAKGTVEAITVRSLKLRHSRGALYTVPFGSISMVNNQSRDYVIVKLEFTVAFDADLLKAKKLVKNINLDLQEDPELSEPLLQPLKFQGVRRMEQYGMVVGVKFTAKPGEQWVLRREIYQRVRDAFNNAGISFAYPQVIIQVPEGAHVPNSALEAAAGLIALEKDQTNKQQSETR